MQETQRTQIATLLSVEVTPRKFVVILFPISMGLGLGFLIASGEWLYAIAVAFFVPLAVLLNTHPFVGVIVWLLLMPFASALPNAEIVYWSFHRILILLTLFMVILPRTLKINKFLPVQLGPPELAIGIIAVLVPSSIFLIQVNFQESFRYYIDRILIPFCLYLVVRLTAPRELDLQLLQWTALFIIISQSVIGLLSWFAPQILPPVWHYWQGFRTNGSLKDPAVFTSMLVFCTTLLFQGVMNSKQNPKRFVFLGACGMGAICVFLSLERGSWLGGILVSLGLFILYPKPILRLIPFAVIIIVILGNGILSRQIAAANERINEMHSINDRIIVTDAMLQMIQIKPIFGWGYETLDKNIWKFYRQVGIAYIKRGIITSHNTYLTILTEFGPFGLILYLFPLVWWLKLSIQSWKQMPKEGLWSRSLLAIFWLVILHIFIVSNFIDMRWHPIGLTLWWMVLGLIANLVYPYPTKKVSLKASLFT